MGSARINWNNIFEYREGKIFWKIKASKKVIVGSEAFTTERFDGYHHGHYNKKDYLRHRVIWEMFNGPIPKGMVIDHINRKPGDDRIENLRCTTYKGNARNSIKNTKCIGVSCVKDKKSPIGFRYSAYATIDGKNTYLGSSYDYFEACCYLKSYEANGTLPRSITEGVYKTNKSGFKYVSFHKLTSRWVVSIVRDGVTHHLGEFDSIEEAVKIRDMWIAQYNKLGNH